MTQTGQPAHERLQARGEPRASGPGERRVGGYRLLALIGEGGMGVVHLARAEDGRRVALKVLRPHVVGDREARERLAREVSSLRLVHSPRVAEVLDADPHAPMPYVATRYVPGLSLHEHVREEGPLTGTDLLHFARCLTEALVAVHAVGVLHRDVKPSNVLMEGRSPVLIDFGLARLAEDSRLTHTGWLLGTPGYLAPEILYGDDATPASDVHAWAATVVFAATGRPPYGKGPAMAVMDRVRRGEHDLRGVPEPLAGLLRQALASEPLERPTLGEITRWLDDAAVLGAAGEAAPAPDPGWTRPVVAIERPAPTVVRRDLDPDPYDPDPFDADPYDRLDAPTTDVASGEERWADPAADAYVGPDPFPEPGPELGLELGPGFDPDVGPAPYTRTLQRHDPLPPGIEPQPAGSPKQRRAQLLGLGAVLTLALATAPYLTTIVATLLVLLVRAASIGRERHTRRRTIRGRSRWFDVPTTALASPGYLLLAALGSLLLVGWAVASSVAFGVVETVFHPPLALGMTLLGAVFAVGVWWGPGSLRVREMVGGGAERLARREVAGLVVVGLCVVAALVLASVLIAAGPVWSPATDAPWSRGVLASVARHI